MTRELGIAKNDMQMAAAIHQRWMLRRNRRQEDPGYVESWWAEQCGHADTGYLYLVRLGVITVPARIASPTSTERSGSSMTDVTNSMLLVPGCSQTNNDSIYLDRSCQGLWFRRAL